MEGGAGPRPGLRNQESCGELAPEAEWWALLPGMLKQPEDMTDFLSV